MCEDISCPLSAEDCSSARLDPCCVGVCSESEWRAQNGLAGFITNLTRSLFGFDGSGAERASRINASTLSPIRGMIRRNSTGGHPGLQRFRENLYSSRDFHDRRLGWESAELTNYADTPSSGSYEAIIIGITLLILCLLVIGIVFVMALHRLRKIRFISPRRSDSRRSRSANGEDQPPPVTVAFITDPPPAYELWKPVCTEPPPTYEQYIQQQTTGSALPTPGVSGESAGGQSNIMVDSPFMATDVSCSSAPIVAQPGETHGASGSSVPAESA